MSFREALSDFERHRGDDRYFPGERRTLSGLFAGHGGRLVHVSPDGSVRDFGYPLSGLSGLRRARFGVEVDGDVAWFGGGRQSYWEDTTLVRTVHEDAGVRQYDWTVDGAHVTGFELPGGEGATIVVYASFTPDGREGRVGHLDHGDAVEAFHAAEHDFLASATGIDRIDGGVVGFEEVLSPDGSEAVVDGSPGRFEERSLTGDLLLRIPAADGSATVVTLPVDEGDTDRGAALDRVRDLAGAVRGGDAFRDLAPSTNGPRPTGTTLRPRREELVSDLRALGLLSAPGGLRAAGPEFDPFYAHSGGYGYTWFRDDAEVARHLLAADREFDLGLAGWHERSAIRYAETQLEDGTWPHRVWPHDGSIAPGWAHGRLEAGSGENYQADQTASVASFLAAYLGEATGDVAGTVESSLRAAVAGLDDSMADDGRPVVCQNAWENSTGRFTHTAATFLGAYARVAATDLAPDVRDRARERADTIYGSLDDLWVEDRDAFAVREYSPSADADGLDDRLDSSTLALVDAHLAYDRIGAVGDRRLDRLVAHVRTIVDGLFRETPAIEGLVRFEGDTWRTRGQDREKVWTVSTGAGAHACALLGSLLDDRGDDRASATNDRALALLEPLLSDGSLCVAGGYLPEQFYDDGRPDSATPLGWSHAIRSATIARLARNGRLQAPAPVDD